MQREMVTEVLLNTLEGERHVRGPLLRTVADELEALGLAAAAVHARALSALEERERDGDQLPESDFRAAVGCLRQLVRGLLLAEKSGRAAAPLGHTQIDAGAPARLSA